MRKVIGAAAALLVAAMPAFAQTQTQTPPRPATPSPTVTVPVAPAPTVTTPSATAPATTTIFPTVQAPAVTTPAPATASPVLKTSPGAPVAGANSFTEAQARARIEASGFTNVSGLAKDDKSIWRGKAMKGGQSVSIALDYQGNVVVN